MSDETRDEVRRERPKLKLARLRHKSTKTTEAYYARIRAEGAFAEIERAFEAQVKIRPSPARDLKP